MGEEYSSSYLVVVRCTSTVYSGKWYLYATPVPLENVPIPANWAHFSLNLNLSRIPYVSLSVYFHYN